MIWTLSELQFLGVCFTCLSSGAADLPVPLVTDPGPQDLHDLSLPRLVLGLLGLQQDVRQLLAAPESLTALAHLALAWQ